MGSISMLDMIKEINMCILRFLIQKIFGIIIEKTDGLYNIRTKRMFFTKAEKGDRFPSDSFYDGEHLINFYIMHNCVNARFFVDEKRVVSIRNISKLYFLWFVFINAILYKLFKKMYLFNLSDAQKNELAHYHYKESEYSSHINLLKEYEMVKQFYNKDIDYYPEKKYYDRMLSAFNITNSNS